MENSIQIFSEYPRDKFIPLVPVQTITQISPLHRVNINVVQISTDERERDAYKEGKNGEYALTKKGLMKLMATANIQIIESKSVTPSSCQRCLGMAKATGKPCSCGGCDCKNDVAWQVTIAVPDLSGGFRRVTATREFICADEKSKASDGQYKQAFAFRSAHAESKALNRALREALMIKSTYRADELAKPFAVPVISPNFEDADLKAAMVRRFAQGENMLFGGTPAQALPSQVIEIPPDEPDEFDGPEALPSAEPEHVECQECGAVLAPFTDSKGEMWDIGRISAFGTERYGKVLCARCLGNLARRQQGGGGR
ncbi:hypothetical protein [Aminirod propionatiphilus]|uniref:Uncharacterized protein n=1 Tax=Aminirod propionatiphilus TaxID=3415223 RepID=A0ACD1DXW9_9BACT|nr:hypothetical protein KIH16_04355 [Synergistota bacterium]